MTIVRTWDVERLTLARECLLEAQAHRGSAARKIAQDFGKSLLPVPIPVMDIGGGL